MIREKISHCISVLILVALCSCVNEKEEQEQTIDELINKAWVAKNNDMPELAVEYCNRAIDIDKTNWKPYAIRARVNSIYNSSEGCNLFDDYRCAVLMDSLRETVVLKNSDSISYKFIYERMCDYSLKCYSENMIERTLMLAQEGLDKFPNDTILLYLISISYSKAEKYELAEIWANKLLNLNCIDGYFCLGYMYNYQNRLFEAEKNYLLFIKESKNLSHSLTAKDNLSAIYFKLQRNSEAIDLRKECAREGSEDAQKWLKKQNIIW